MIAERYRPTRRRQLPNKASAAAFDDALRKKTAGFLKSRDCMPHKRCRHEHDDTPVWQNLWSTDFGSVTLSRDEKYLVVDAEGLVRVDLIYTEGMG